jgi:hypothetical protein
MTHSIHIHYIIDRGRGIVGTHVINDGSMLLLDAAPREELCCGGAA